MDQKANRVHSLSPPEAKIALFRSLFRGREDIYPRRYENQTTGKTSYQPACGNEWIRGICEKPRIKCSACSHQRFLPVTDEVIKWHLSGIDDSGRDFVMGLYPLLRDESCFFLTIDLDRPDWQHDSRAILQTCQRFNLSAAIERSRSGLQGHAWLFFDQAIPATLARKLGTHLLTEALDLRPEIGLNAYDRCVPNQDTLPQNSYCSLIALPLQKQARDVGNTVFLDEHHQPYADQWAFLASLHKNARPLIEAIVSNAQKQGRLITIRLAPDDEGSPSVSPATPAVRRPKEFPIAEALPKRVELILRNQILIEKVGLPSELRNRLIGVADFQNPEFYQAQSMRLPVYGKPRIISCAEDHAQHIGLPRGCLDDVQELLSRLKIETTVQHEQQAGQPLEVEFQGELRPEQEVAAKALLAYDTGVLSAATAFGKTVVASWLIAQRGVNVLILVHRRQLLEQWVERLASFLGLPHKSIGRIGGGRKKPSGVIDVAVIQSLIRQGAVSGIVENYGYLIVDECHHLSAHSFEQVVRRAKPKFITGLSATLTRKDGHHPIIFMQCGPIRHHVDALAQATVRPFEHLVHVRPTAFLASEIPAENVRIQFQDLYTQLIADAARINSSVTRWHSRFETGEIPSC